MFSQAAEDNVERLEIESRLTDFFVTHSDYRPQGDEDLFESGALDSFGIVEFLSFIESELGCEIPIDEITAENFSTVRKVADLILAQG